MKKLHTVLLFFGMGFLAYLVWKSGPGDLGRKLAALHWGIIPLLLGEGVAEMFHTAGWRHCLSGPSRSMSFARLFRLRMAGYAINSLTPTAALGGEAAKAVLLASTYRGAEASSGVLIDKVCFALGDLLFVMVGAIFLLRHIQLPPALWAGMVLSGSLVTSGVLAFLLLQKYGKLGGVLRWLTTRHKGHHRLQRAATHLTEVDEAMKLFYREHPRDLVLATGWHLLGHAVAIVPTWLFLSLLNQHASLMVAAEICFLGLWFDLATFIVPLNLGTQEWSRIVALRAFGYDALIGLTYGVMLRLGQLFWSAIGLVNYGLLVLESPAQRVEQGHAPGQAGTPERFKGRSFFDLVLARCLRCLQRLNFSRRKDSLRWDSD